MHSGADALWCPRSLAAFDPARDFVVHWWRDAERRGFYVDAARAIEIAKARISYVDLYLDVSYDGGSWHTLDEDELRLASDNDARTARHAADEILTMAARGDPIFDSFGELWEVPADAASLPALEPPTLG